MESSAFQSTKLALVSMLSLSRDALHIYVGLGVLLATMLLLKKPLRSPVPWLLVLVVALAGELWDGYDDLGRIGRIRWPASLHDIWNTIFWPTLLLLLARSGLIATGSPSTRSDS